jgi:hypothetical protein
VTARPSRAGKASPVAPAGPGLRLLDGLAGLFAAGMLLIGFLLVLSALVAPALLGAAGLGPADGPGWSRVLGHLLVGVTGELVVRRRGSWPPAVRVAADLGVLVAAVGVIWLAWWR